MCNALLTCNGIILLPEQRLVRVSTVSSLITITRVYIYTFYHTHQILDNKIMRQSILLSPRFFLKKSVGDIEIASVRPSVRPSRYLLVNHWTKSDPNLVCELLT